MLIEKEGEKRYATEKDGWRNMAFAENLARLREAANKTQEELAEEIGVSRSSVAKWESGEGMPKIPNLIALRNVLHCPIDDMLRNEPGMENSVFPEDLRCNCCSTRMLRVNERFWNCPNCGNRAFCTEEQKTYFQYEPIQPMEHHQKAKENK